MKTIYLLKWLTYKLGVVLKSNTPYSAVWNNEASVWAVKVTDLVQVNVAPKFVEKVV